MVAMSLPVETLVRNPFEAEAFAYYDTKRDDALNLHLGHLDGLYHHHFAVGDFDRSVLELTGHAQQSAISHEIHRLETRQVDSVLGALTQSGAHSRILDAGSGRGGTAFLLHHVLGCRVDGVNFSAYQNRFARAQALERGVADMVHFHDLNMTHTRFPAESFDAVVTNETTMYVELDEAFSEFARVLETDGRYVLLTWCVNDTVVPGQPVEATIDAHYRCRTHSRRGYLRALLDAGFVPYQVDDLTQAAIPYWELRSRSELTTGIEQTYLDGYRSGRISYIRIVSRKAG
ncbi:methyltransferase domain-containing protein [Streptomyces sp. SCSIO 30461]|uniref:SAM-dependent methyltransferase n=1 Tax=Streptomyces sp. SCSIO 30461 TaxID=3118085 RepID=UPI0030D2F528